MPAPKFESPDYIGINGVGFQQLIHPHFEMWQDYFNNEFKIRKNIKIIIFLPCAAIKPYYNSAIHKEFNKIIDKYKNIQKIVISNAGVIPYEFCDKYPFNSYDWNPLFETPEIMEQYLKITITRIIKFFQFKKNNLKSLHFIAYLRNESESLISIEKAFKQLGLNLKIINITGELPKTTDWDLKLILPENLIKLENELKMVY